MKIEVISFGRKHGKVPKAFSAVDCTSLPNPHVVSRLKNLDGRHTDIIKYVTSPTNTNPFGWKYVIDYAHMLVDRRRIRRVAFTCVGGRHRSVVAAEHFAEVRRKMGDTVEVVHTHLTNGVAQ